MSTKHGTNRMFPRANEGGDELWTLYGGSVVGLTTLADTVAIGATTMTDTEKLRVVGGILVDDPTSLAAYTEWRQGSAAPVAPLGSARTRYDEVANQYQLSINGGPYMVVGTIPTMAYVQGGNAFAATAVLGTTDAFDLTIITGAVEIGRFTVAGAFPGALLIGATTPVLDEKLRVSRSFAANASFFALCELTELNLTAGAQVGSVVAKDVELRMQGASTADGLIAQFGLAFQESTGAVGGFQAAFFATFGAGDVAVALGAVPEATGFVSAPYIGVSTSVAIGLLTGFDALGFSGTDATHTIATARGVRVRDQGATGVTDAIGVDVELQAGAAAKNLGIRTQSALVIANTTVAGAELLRVSGSALFDSGTFTVSVTGAVSINSTGGALNLGSNADAFAINIGTGAAARAITVGNVTGATSLTFNSGTGAVLFTAGGAWTVSAAGVVSINSTGGTLNLGNNANAFAINIGTGAAARTVTVGNSTGATSVVVDAGTGPINVGSTAVARSINLGVAAATQLIGIGGGVGATAIAMMTGTGTLAFTLGGLWTVAGTGAITINASAGAISIGSNADAFAINIGTGAAARAIAIGNSTGATGVVINAGTANIDIGTSAVARSTNLATGAAIQTLICGSTTVGSTTTVRAGATVATLTNASFALAATTTAFSVDVLPSVDNLYNCGSATFRWALVRGVTVTSGDLAFEDRVCHKCQQPFAVSQELRLIVIAVLCDEENRPITRTVPVHVDCGAYH